MAGICEAQFLKISETPTKGYFPLSAQDRVTEICYSDNDFEVVKIAADMLSSDIETITGRRPVKVNKPNNPAIVVGTLGKNPVLDKIIKKYSLDTESIAGKWESFIITRVFLNKKTPLLLVIGSARRGTAYGLMSISEAIGVSPWYWWADVKPQKKNELYIENRYYVQKSPSVQYHAYEFANKHDVDGFSIETKGLGCTDGVLVQPFDAPSFDVENAPYVEYVIDINPNDSAIEIRTLPTLHVYEGRDVRYAVQIGNGEPQVFNIHEGDFTSEWRLNVLRGYATRTIKVPAEMNGRQKLRIYFLDPGITLQEILVR